MGSHSRPLRRARFASFQTYDQKELRGQYTAQAHMSDQSCKTRPFLGLFQLKQTEATILHILSKCYCLVYEFDIFDMDILMA